jgi:hypothetical protein
MNAFELMHPYYFYSFYFRLQRICWKSSIIYYMELYKFDSSYICFNYVKTSSQIIFARTLEDL